MNAPLAHVVLDRVTKRFAGHTAVDGLSLTVGLADWRLRRTNELSKRMQQKVQFIATLLHEPDLVILDEPFSGLDPVNTQVMKNTVLELRRRGATILFSTHIMEQAEKLCDQLCSIARGRKLVRRTVVNRVGVNRVRSAGKWFRTLFVVYVFLASMPIHHTLKAWQHSQRLAVECVKAATKFPEYEQDALADQLRRACYSIPLNIAAGSTRKGTRDYRRHLDIAWGSLAEVQTVLTIARDVGYLQPAAFGRLEALAIETSKTLFGLLRKVSQSAAKLPRSR